MKKLENIQHAKVSKIVDFYNCKKITVVPDLDTKEFADFKPGQYAILYIDFHGHIIHRPHSIASSPALAKKEYSFFIKKNKEGLTSKHIHKHWKVGTKLALSMPQGDLWIKDYDCKNVIACCQGNSLTPFLSMAWAIADNMLDINLTILHGVDYEKDLIFKPELLEIIDKTNGKFKLVNLVSKQPTKLWKSGLITAKEVALAANNKEFTLLATGGKIFYKHMDRIAKKLKLPANRYRKDVVVKESSNH